MAALGYAPGAAVKWFRKAAERGYARAQNSLGFMYAKGQGVPRDHVEAYKWIILAEAQGYKQAAEVRDNIATRMTPAQIAEAQRLARVWRSKQPAAESP